MRPHHRITTTRTAVLISAMTGAMLCLQGVGVLGHEGHGGVAPVFRDVRAGAETWRIGVGIAPADPLAGELIRIEVKAAPMVDGAEGPAAGAALVRLRLDGEPLSLTTANASGVLGADVRVEEPGPHRLQVDVSVGPGAAAEVPLQVQPGPAGRLRQVIALAFVLMLAIVAAVLARSLRARWTDGGTPQRATLAIVMVGLLVGAWWLSGAIARVLAREFLPDRSHVEIDWVPEAAPAAGSTPEDGTDRTSRGDDATHAAAPADGITARVVAAPGAIAEITVPMPGRIVAADGPRVTLGSRVRKGQELTRLQPSYIMHDALHLINQRWPILQAMVDAKREMLQAEAAAERLKLAVADKAAAASSLQAAETAAVSAKAEFERWSRTLRMHDVQITDDQPARVPILSPIGGDVAAANFAQGQLVYEGDALFTIVDLSTVWIEARVPEQLVASFNQKTIIFESPTFPDLTFRGHLQRVAPAVEPQSRTLSHFYAVSNPRKLLRVGMLLRATDHVDGRPDAAP